MSAVKMILEDEASGRVKEIYDEIMAALGIDFVPNMYKLIHQYSLSFASAQLQHCAL